jgi:hypothetical protein
MKYYIGLVFLWAASFAATEGSGSARAADPWADAVVSYIPGSNPAAGFTDPAAALGAPTRFTDPN